MKKVILLATLLVLLITTKTANAVEKGDFNMNLTTNLGHHTFIGGGSTAGAGYIPGFTLNMDYAASPYFGFGGWFTFNGKKYNDLYSYKNLGVGVRGVFHLYQLISEKGNAKLDANKFDVYIPLHVGGGFTLKDKNLPGSKFRGGAIVGASIGATYYFVEHIGANLEVGYAESSYAKFGLAFKF